MTRDELTVELVELFSTGYGGLVYVERRRGDVYDWAPADAGERPAGDELPEAWIYFDGPRPVPGERDRVRGLVDDLIAEMESMAGGSDRCRWPLDDPYFHRH